MTFAQAKVGQHVLVRLEGFLERKTAYSLTMLAASIDVPELSILKRQGAKTADLNGEPMWAIKLGGN